MSTKTGRASDQFMLRMPDGLKEQLKEVAKRNRRSTNAQIVTMLEAQLRESVATGTVA
ncbi:Arc family DNA-binding protein [Nitrobacter sp. TKz-YC02]|uniref:Arc family DNA-binding protein n=1 Tax=Nitrobacter sp. TKz-YC02 TaxID=3398704 RepID=UPI003CEE39B5